MTITSVVEDRRTMEGRRFALCCICARKVVGLSAAELADRLTAIGYPISKPRISQWEAGDLRRPHARLAKAMALATGQTESYFMGFDGQLTMDIDPAHVAAQVDEFITSHHMLLCNLAIADDPTEYAFQILDAIS